ncbi:MAG: DUF1080 domain-containing protein, partial [Verrucomicrobia bacterium]|nr:DUF1080 domain-containing protein [Verrucomicrobiota bacterium]
MPLHRFTLTVALLASALINAFAAEAITPAAKTELFNGKDTSGWVVFPEETSKETWSIKDGILSCVGKPNGFLRTEKSYKQYRFTVEWRFTKPGNTGVVVHMTPPDAIWPKSIECQGMHKNQGDFYFWNGATLTGGTELKDKKTGKTRGYRLGKQADAEKPAGEWNTFTTVCDGNTVTILVNGKEVNKAT